MQIVYSKRASEDLVNLLDYVYERNPSATKNIISSLEKTEKMIADFPFTGKLTDISLVRVAPIGRYPYLIFWTVNSNEVQILHIRDARRITWQGD